MSNLLKAVSSAATGLLAMTPIGGIVKSITGGATKLLLGKAAEKIGMPSHDIENLLGKAAELSQTDQTMVAAIQSEETERRKFELEFFGRAADLDPKAQLWRAVTRPAISWSIVGLAVIGLLLQWSAQIFGFAEIVIPVWLLDTVKYVLGFWFGGRTLEKVTSIIKG